MVCGGPVRGAGDGVPHAGQRSQVWAYTTEGYEPKDTLHPSTKLTKLVSKGISRVRTVLIWAAFATSIALPIVASTASLLLAWRNLAYIVAGFAGVLAMALLHFQSLLVAGYLPGLSSLRGGILYQRQRTG